MKSETINNEFSWARLIINNARQHPLIQQKLTEWGYASTMIVRGETLLTNAQLAQQAQKDTNDTRQSANRRWKSEWESFQQQYSEHRAVAKTLFRKDPDILQRLRLDRRVPTRIADILDQSTDFYNGLAGKEKNMQKLGIKSEVLAQAREVATSLDELRANCLQSKGNAESATHKRNQALTDLRTWRKEFIRVAKMALKDDPQLLEVLGIVVSA